MDELRLVLLNQCLNGFDFNDQIFFYAEVREVIANDLSFIAHFDWLLLPDANAALL